METIWETAGRTALAMLEDQYTDSDREMCDRVVAILTAARKAAAKEAK